MSKPKKTKEQVIQEALELATQIQEAVAALETDIGPEAMLDHVGALVDQGRTNALRSVIRDRALELFEQRHERVNSSKPIG
jgi:hypothetical protein